MDNNILTAAQGVNHPALFSSSLRASQLHWISAVPADWPFECSARIRHQQPVQACTLTLVDEQECHVSFKQPQRAITPGQSVVFYQGEECLGGAIIEAAVTE